MPDRGTATPLAVLWLRFLRWLGYPVTLPSEGRPWFHDATLTSLQRQLNEQQSLIAEHVFDEPRRIDGAVFSGRWIRMRDRHGKPLRVESWGFDIEPVDSTRVLADVLRKIPVRP